MKKLLLIALALLCVTAAAQEVSNNLVFTLDDPGVVAISIRPSLPYSKTYAGPPRSIEFRGGTAYPAPMPYLLSAYFNESGAFHTGVPIVSSNKRINIDGAIQGVSALPDGSEPSMLSVSPDVNGPSVAIESYGAMGPGFRNNTIIAGYDLDSVHWGATPYSRGFGRKTFAIGARGQMFWGGNLSTDPAANADAFLSQSGGTITLGHRLTVQSPTGNASLRLDAAAGDTANLCFQKAGAQKWCFGQLNYLDFGSGPYFALIGPSGSRAMMFGPNNNIGIGKDPDTAKLSVVGDVRATGSVQLQTAGRGVVLKSPNGSICKSVTIDNLGALVLTTVTCP